MPERKILDLMALGSDGSETQFDGAAFPIGIHLRWSFPPELGWPADGFDIKRRYGRSTTPLLPWQTIVSSLRLPTTTAEIVTRARTSLSGSALAPYEMDAASLLDLVNKAKLGAAIVGARGKQSMKLPAATLLAMASLDPHVARAVALSYIDGAVPVRTYADYQVVGKWTATQLWPFTETRFSPTTVPPKGLAIGHLDLDHLYAATARALSIVPAGSAHGLRASGAGSSPIKLFFPKPVREVEVEFVGVAPSSITWNLQAWESATVAPYSPPFTTTSTILRVTAPATALITQLGIASTSTAWTNWTIVAVRHRQNIGSIGTQTSTVARMSNLGPTIPEDSTLYRWPATQVFSPRITDVRTDSIPSTIAPDGRYAPPSSQASVVLSTMDPAADPQQQPLTKPARVHSLYFRYAGGGSPSRTVTPTLPAPAVGPLLATPAYFWKLDGAATATNGGAPLTARGAVGYRSMGQRIPITTQYDMDRSTVWLKGRSGGVGNLETSSTWLVNGTELHVALWVFPTEDTETFPTLVGNDYTQSFWLGLSKSGTTYRPRLWVNGSVFEATSTIPQGAWSHVAFHYDGQWIRFFVNGALVGSEIAAARGPIRANPRGTLCFGADPIVGGDQFAYPFAGYLSDVQIRRGTELAARPQERLAHWSLDNTLLESAANLTSATLGAPAYVVDHPEVPTRRSGDFNGTWCVKTTDATGTRLCDLGRQLCIRVRIKPAAGMTGLPTIVGTGSWRLALQVVSGGYRPALQVGNSTVSPIGSTIVPAGVWSDVVIVTDGRVVCYINGKAAGSVNQVVGRIPKDASNTVYVGAAAGSIAGSLLSPYRGQIADLEISVGHPRPAAPLLLVDRAESRRLEDVFSPLTPPTPTEETGDFVISGLEPASYFFAAYGVDIFGRLSPSASLSSAITLPNTTVLPVPGGERARFLPLLGTITQASPPADAESADPLWTVVVDADDRGVGQTVPSVPAAAYAGHDAELSTVQMLPAGHPAAGRQQLVSPESYEIVSATGGYAALSLTLRAPSLPSPAPAIGQRVSVSGTRAVRTEWTWTGTQRVLSPEVTRFRASERRWRPATKDAAGNTLVAGAYTAPAIIGTEVAVVGDEVLQTGTTPLATVSVAAGSAIWNDLQSRGVTSLPTPERVRIWQISLPVPAALPTLPSRLNPQQSTPDTFVGGCLVAFNSAADVQGWQQFTVLWHDWSAATGWKLYVVENSKGTGAASGDTPVLTMARYYPGQRYRADAEIAPISYADVSGDPVPSATIEITVESRDAAGASSHDQFGPPASDARRPGSADAVAVKPKRPPVPGRPDVSIGRADYHGRGHATVTWLADAGVQYNLLRATDNAIFAADVASRRAGKGHYASPVMLARFTGDEATFQAWIDARWPNWSTDWQTRLFVERPFDEGDQAGIAAWEAANVVWREWAARYYPTLSPSQVSALADRAGNESAFTLVNVAPIDATMPQGKHVDVVTGSVRNRYYYRLQGMETSGANSIRLGPTSLGKTAEVTRAPRRVDLVAIEAGDRAATLFWTAPDDPDTTAFRVYRADDPALLEDMRWDVPYVVTVPDPRPRVQARGVRLPLSPSLSIDAILGVYDRREVSQCASLEAAPTRAFNYFDPASGSTFTPATVTTPEHVVSNLRPIGDRVWVAVRYRELGTGAVKEHGLFPRGVTHRDEGLVGRRKYYYRVASLAVAPGIPSEPSRVLAVQVPELEPPPPPEWVRAEWVRVNVDGDVVVPPADPPDATDAVLLKWTFDSSDPLVTDGVEVRVQRRAPTGAWIAISGWLPLSTTSAVDRTADITSASTYRIAVRSCAGTSNREFLEQSVPALGGNT